MDTYVFNTNDASQHGVEAAVLLYNLRFWCERNAVNGKNIHDGLAWTYNSAEAFSQLFPFWTRSKIARLLRGLEESGAIRSGNYNKIAYDRTKWYAVSDQSNFHFGTNHFTDLDNEKYKSEQPIPDVNTDIKPDVNTVSPPLVPPKVDARGTRLPNDWHPSQADIEFALKQGLTYDDVNDQAERFRDYWHSTAGAKGRKACWHRTWKNWVRKCADDRSKKRAYRPGTPHGSGNSTVEVYARVAAERERELARRSDWFSSGESD